MSIADELQKLEDLRCGGALSETEFAKAKAAVLAGAADRSPVEQHLSEQLAEVRYQNELARIDREWETEREKYMFIDKFGRRHVPIPGAGIAVAVIGGVFGVLLLIMAFALAGWAPPTQGPFVVAKTVIPLFGLVFIIAVVGLGLHGHWRAQAYQKAHAAYQARRQQIQPEQFR